MKQVCSVRAPNRRVCLLPIRAPLLSRTGIPGETLVIVLRPGAAPRRLHLLLMMEYSDLDTTSRRT